MSRASDNGQLAVERVERAARYTLAPGNLLRYSVMLVGMIVTSIASSSFTAGRVSGEWKIVLERVEEVRDLRDELKETNKQLSELSGKFETFMQMKMGAE